MLCGLGEFNTARAFVDANHAVHHWLVNGVPVETLRPDGTVAGGLVRLLDFDDPAANDWLAVDHVTVIEQRLGITYHRRPDVVVYVNGLPLGILELKNAADQQATVWTAFQQLQTYEGEAVLVVVGFLFVRRVSGDSALKS